MSAPRPPTDAGALQVGAEYLIAHFLRVRLLWVQATVASARLALVFLLSPGEAVALELVAATIGAKMFGFFDDHEVGLLSRFRRS